MRKLMTGLCAVVFLFSLSFGAVGCANNNANCQGDCAKCPADCKQPCCAKDTKACKPGCTKPCTPKK